MDNLGLDRLAYVDIFYTRPRPILTRDFLIDSTMQLIHTYVNRLRGRMDDVTDMLFWTTVTKLPNLVLYIRVGTRLQLCYVADALKTICNASSLRRSDDNHAQ